MKNSGEEGAPRDPQEITNSVSAVSGITISGLGIRNSTEHNRLYQPRVLKEYALVYLLEGDGEFESPAGRVPTVKKGEAFFLFPDTWHLYGPKQGGFWREVWILFSGPFVQQLRRNSLLDHNRPVHRFSQFRQREIEKKLHHLTELHRALGFGRTDTLIALTVHFYHVLLLMLSSQDPGDEQSCQPRGQRGESNQEELRNMEQLLEDRLLSRQNISRFFCTDRESYHTLRLKFKKLTGMTPARHLNTLRMERAKELLLWTDLPINEIADACGISDQFYFSRLFKQHTGEAPSAFRSRFVAAPESGCLKMPK